MVEPGCRCRSDCGHGSDERQVTRPGASRSSRSVWGARSLDASRDANESVVEVRPRPVRSRPACVAVSRRCDRAAGPARCCARAAAVRRAGSRGRSRRHSGRAGRRRAAFTAPPAGPMDREAHAGTSTTSAGTRPPPRRQNASDEGARPTHTTRDGTSTFGFVR